MGLAVGGDGLQRGARDRDAPVLVSQQSDRQRAREVSLAAAAGGGQLLAARCEVPVHQWSGVAPTLSPTHPLTAVGSTTAALSTNDTYTPLILGLHQGREALHERSGDPH